MLEITEVGLKKLPMTKLLMAKLIHNKAVALVKLQNYSESILSFQKVLELDPDYRNVQGLLKSLNEQMQ